MIYNPSAPIQTFTALPRLDGGVPSGVVDLTGADHNNPAPETPRTLCQTYSDEGLGFRVKRPRYFDRGH